MQTIENGKERMRNPPAAPFANTKNLHVKTQLKGWYLYLIIKWALLCMYFCVTYSDIAIALALKKRKSLLWNINLLEHWKIIPLSMKLEELCEEWKYLFTVPHDGSSTKSRTNGSEPNDEIKDCNTLFPSTSWEWGSFCGNYSCRRWRSISKSFHFSIAPGPPRFWAAGGCWCLTLFPWVHHNGLLQFFCSM